MKKKLVSLLVGITLVVSNCAYVGAVDIGDGSSDSFSIGTTDFSDETQEDDTGLFSDGTSEVPAVDENEENIALPAALTECATVGVKGTYIAATQAVLAYVHTKL